MSSFETPPPEPNPYRSPKKVTTYYQDVRRRRIWLVVFALFAVPLSAAICGFAACWAGYGIETLLNINTGFVVLSGLGLGALAGAGMVLYVVAKRWD